MTTPDDDLKKLADTLKSAAPAPNAARKAANIAAAMENFDRVEKNFQGSDKQARPTLEATPKGAFLKGVAKMLDTLTSRAAMATTTAIVAVGFTFYVVMPQMGVNGGLQAPEHGVETAQMPMPEAPKHTPAPLGDAGASTSGDDVLGGVLPEIVAEMEADPASDGYALAPQAELSPEPNMVLASPVVDMAVSRDLRSGAISREEGGEIADANTEAFANEAPNPLKITTENPVSTFSIDVDTAAYAVVRNSLMQGVLPPKDAVRIEEMINYFPYEYAAPEGVHPFQPTVTVTGTPWNDGTNLVHIAIQGEMPALDDRPALNLVFLIDTSGSMESANKLPLLKQSFRLMLSQLRPQDQVSIVTYAGSAGQVLEPTAASEQKTILAALNRLSAGGGTAGQEGLQQAYSVAESMAQEGEVSRIILATDGDFNVGIYDPDALKDYIADKRETGVYLSVLGFGRGNLDDATMQALAQNGNGTASYIDTLSEAQKVLVDQLSGALFPIADDVKIQVEFNPAEIAEYRLIGYETRALAREDFNNDLVDAGEIGAGHSVTAIYEVTPVGSDAIMSDALRYQAPVETGGSGELGFLKLRYKTPGQDVSTLIEVPITPDMGTASDEVRFGVAIAGFGQILTDGKYLGGWDYDDAIALAQANKGADDFGYRAEAITLMRLANTLDQE